MCFMVVSLMAVQCGLMGLFYVGSVRNKVFSKQFMEQFKEEHTAAFPEQSAAPLGGLPDAGCGYYARKLPYIDWLRFNNAMRAHINTLEMLPMAIGCVAVTGLKYPWIGFGEGVLILIGRIAYLIGYHKSADKRAIGSVIAELGIAVSGITAIVACGMLYGDLKHEDF